MSTDITSLSLSLSLSGEHRAIRGTGIRLLTLKARIGQNISLHASSVASKSTVLNFGLRDSFKLWGEFLQILLERKVTSVHKQ